MYAVVVLFQLVTLPVEFDASRRGHGVSDHAAASRRPSSRGAYSRVLRACALTYVAAALTSILQLWLWASAMGSEPLRRRMRR